MGRANNDRECAVVCGRPDESDTLAVVEPLLLCPRASGMGEQTSCMRARFSGDLVRGQTPQASRMCCGLGGARKPRAWPLSPRASGLAHHTSCMWRRASVVTLSTARGLQHPACAVWPGRSRKPRALAAVHWCALGPRAAGPSYCPLMILLYGFPHVS